MHEDSERWRRAVGVLASTLMAACSSFTSEATAPNHEIEVVATNIQLSDGLAFHPSGSLLATQEYRGGGIVRIDLESGSFSYVHRDLSDPDNIVVIGTDIYVTEEAPQGRIVRIDTAGRMTTFASGLDGPEGLDVGPDGKLYVAEHATDGHVYRYSLKGRRDTVGRVTNGEGLRVLPDGSVVVAETSEDRVSRFMPDGTKTVVVEKKVHAPDGIAYDPVRQRLLVTEDAAPGRMLRVDLESGALEVIATGLHAPQTMLLEPDGSILVSEQGEDRILRLRPKE